MKKNTIIAAVVLVLVISGIFIYIAANNGSTDDIKEAMNTHDQSQDLNEVEDTSPLNTIMEKAKNYRYSGKLEDVTASETETRTRGVMLENNTTGTAYFDFRNGEFKLFVEFKNLPNPNGDDFYEGWLVRKEPFDFISTGELEIYDGNYVNEYSSTADYREYNFYVLTVEPNDGDPAPAGHIMEGTLEMN